MNFSEQILNKFDNQIPFTEEELFHFSWINTKLDNMGRLFSKNLYCHPNQSPNEEFSTLQPLYIFPFGVITAAPTANLENGE